MADIARDQAAKFNLDGPTTVWSQCAYCVHRGQSSTLGLAPYCKAFPGGIPEEILGNKADHRKPIEGDEGMGEPGTHVLFTPRQGVPPTILASLYAVLDEA